MTDTIMIPIDDAEVIIDDSGVEEARDVIVYVGDELLVRETVDVDRLKRLGITEGELSWI